MPRLNAALRQMTENAQERSFGPIPAGKYVARLTAVEAKQSQSGNPYWNATYQDLEALDGRKQPGSQWLVLNLPDDGPVPENYRPASSNCLSSRLFLSASVAPSPKTSMTLKARVSPSHSSCIPLTSVMVCL